MPLPIEHPFKLTERDLRRSITRLEHHIETAEIDPVEHRKTVTALNHMRDAYEIVKDHIANE